jgi:SWI/SNF-related matrix-associated actin-dependent regulator 1 of chromatin subfamily A
VGRYIKDIQFEKIDEAVCISVDSPDKLYVTDHAIVTHNTTSTVIASMESGAKKVLIVCPASLKINWKREIENYTDDYVLIVEGKKWGSTYKYYIINYDILKNFHTTENSEDSEAYQIILNEGFDLAIVDEAHYISNSQAQRTQLLNDILAKIPKVWLLTGTPMTSRPINYYNLLKIVNSPLTLNWKSYVMRYCKGYQFRVGGRKVWNTSGASNLDELRDQTKAVVLRRLKTDVLDLPEKIISPIWLELKNSFYDDELSDFLRISEENKEKESITVTLNRLMKLRQLIAIEKVEHTCELIDKILEQGKKVIVFTNFTMSLDMLHEKYKKKSVVLDGRMSKIARQESVDRFQNEDKVKIFIGNIKAAGVGITLTAADTVIMNDLSFVPADHSQAEDRAYRYGQKNSVLVYYPVFENTIEMTVYNILQKKKDIIDQVMGDGEYSESFASELVKTIK